MIAGIGGYFVGFDKLVIEECICRKWAGREVSDTAFQAGRMYQAAMSNEDLTYEPVLISRAAVQGHWGVKGDRAIIEALVARFDKLAYAAFMDGTLSKPKMLNMTKRAWFKGFKSDIWQAYALGVTFIDKNQGV
jgi:hypothetical protein